MSDPRPIDPAVEQFRAALQEAFGPPWVVEPTVDGFVARFTLGSRAGEGYTASDELHVRVVADPGPREFTWSSRRVAASDLDRVRAGWSMAGYSASREVKTGRYSGLRRTMTFRRTPDGLVAEPDAPQDSAGREADLRAVATRLGWTERAGSPGAPLAAAGRSPKRTLVLMAVFAGVVLLVIVGVGIFVVSQVAGAFL